MIEVSIMLAKHHPGRKAHCVNHVVIVNERFPRIHFSSGESPVLAVSCPTAVFILSTAVEYTGNARFFRAFNVVIMVLTLSLIHI